MLRLYTELNGCGQKVAAALPRLNGLIICRKGSELERRLRALAVDSFSMRAIGELFTFGPEFAGPLTLTLTLLLWWRTIWEGGAEEGAGSALFPPLLAAFPGADTTELAGLTPPPPPPPLPADALPEPDCCRLGETPAEEWCPSPSDTSCTSSSSSGMVYTSFTGWKKGPPGV
ncbi:hypothetical protein TYRP_021103 [Tyrophagus putrescentiae]|nr:hypothetical protein TYRP_021103 [Tyrophagus putrescentiae]